MLFFLKKISFYLDLYIHNSKLSVSHYFIPSTRQKAACCNRHIYVGPSITWAIFLRRMMGCGATVGFSLSISRPTYAPFTFQATHAIVVYVFLAMLVVYKKKRNSNIFQVASFLEHAVGGVVSVSSRVIN